MWGHSEHLLPCGGTQSIYCHVGALRASIAMWGHSEHLLPCGSAHSVELSGHLPQRHRASLAMRECSQCGNEPLSAFFTWASPLQGPLFLTCSPVEVQCQSAGVNTVYVSHCSSSDQLLDRLWQKGLHSELGGISTRPHEYVSEKLRVLTTDTRWDT